MGWAMAGCPSSPLFPPLKGTKKSPPAGSRRHGALGPPPTSPRAQRSPSDHSSRQGQVWLKKGKVTAADNTIHPPRSPRPARGVFSSLSRPPSHILPPNLQKKKKNHNKTSSHRQGGRGGRKGGGRTDRTDPPPPPAPDPQGAGARTGGGGDTRFPQNKPQCNNKAGAPRSPAAGGSGYSVSLAPAPPASSLQLSAASTWGRGGAPHGSPSPCRFPRNDGPGPRGPAQVGSALNSNFPN